MPGDYGEKIGNFPLTKGEKQGIQLGIEDTTKKHGNTFCRILYVSDSNVIII
jgi:hypothetical protein